MSWRHDDIRGDAGGMARLIIVSSGRLVLVVGGYLLALMACVPTLPVAIVWTYPSAAANQKQRSARTIHDG